MGLSISNGTIHLIIDESNPLLIQVGVRTESLFKPSDGEVSMLAVA
jgi:hypothetical protein